MLNVKKLEVGTMDRALFIAMTGAKNNMLSQTARSNNLANASTTGFRADWEQARAMPVWGEHFPTRAFSMSERPATDFNDGPLMQTGNELDLAIQGDGFFAVTGPDGEEAYTRRGDVSLLADGTMINGAGLPLVGGGGPIVLPPYERVEISDDGLISILPAGAPENQLVVVDQIKMVNPDYRTMEKNTDGLFRTFGWQAGDPALVADPAVRVLGGFVEGSNVNAVNELVNILSLNRQYEMQVKLMSKTEEMSESSASIMRIS